MPTRITAALTRSRRRTSLVVSLLAGVAGVAGSFAVASFTPGFVAGPVAGATARVVPGAVVTFAIVVLGDFGDHLNLLLALGLSVLLLAGTSLVGVVVGRWTDRPLAGAAVATLAGAVVAVAVTAAPAASLAAGLAAGAVLAAVATWPATSVDTDADADADRRRVLTAFGSALVLSLGGYVLGRAGGPGGTDRETGGAADLPESTRSEVDALLSDAAEKSLAVGGLEPLVSDSFYRVDVNATDPDLAADSWTLDVTGAVAAEREYTYADVREMAAENQFVTLRCVGESLNGRKMDNALWTGVPIRDLLDPTAPADACCVVLRAADGYYEEFPLSALEDGFLAYGMNGEPLPRAHGYPVRALIPGHWGEINVKWLTEIEVKEKEQEGYWEKRGWHGTGPVETVAKLHVAEERSDGRMEVAGHAYAGTRGVGRVEVSTDGGATWADARLSDPLPGADVWRQWAYAYDPPAGEHEVVVRAVEDDGTVQSRQSRPPYPNGPAGWVSRTVGG
ncbi:MAG: molybdopterin-dependent oxidoreductase [Haloplanus sp.]